MSGHVGLREDARLGHLLARRIARLFVPLRSLEKSLAKDGDTQTPRLKRAG